MHRKHRKIVSLKGKEEEEEEGGGGGGGGGGEGEEQPSVYLLRRQ